MELQNIMLVMYNNYDNNPEFCRPLFTFLQCGLLQSYVSLGLMDSICLLVLEHTDLSLVLKPSSSGYTQFVMQILYITWTSVSKYCISCSVITDVCVIAINFDD
jgi:hypothetical protein